MHVTVALGNASPLLRVCSDVRGALLLCIVRSDEFISLCAKVRRANVGVACRSGVIMPQ